MKPITPEDILTAIYAELDSDSYPELIETTALSKTANMLTTVDGKLYRIVVEEVAVDDQGRVGVVDGPRCEWCIKHGVASCSHQGM